MIFKDEKSDFSKAAPIAILSDTFRIQLAESVIL